MHHATYAILQNRHAEVYQQSYPYPPKLEVCEQLSFVDRQEALAALEFDDNLVLHYKIDDVTTIEPDRLIGQRQSDLPLKGYSSRR